MRDIRARNDFLLRAGVVVYGVALAGFGAMNFARLDGVPGIEPLPDWLPAHAAWAVLSGVVLVAARLALIGGWRMRATAQAAAVTLTIWLVCLHAPRLVEQPTTGTVWVPACEVLALAAAGWALSRTLAARNASAACATFGATFVAFALSHVVYLGYVESVIPPWLPAPRAWALGTGAAHLAAGLSLLSRVRARLAATMLAAMFGSWVAVLHLPRVVAQPEAPREWGSLLVALAMCGASLIVAGAVVRDAPLSVARAPQVAGTADMQQSH
jgi:uncharacterized membrane protein